MALKFYDYMKKVCNTNSTLLCKRQNILYVEIIYDLLEDLNISQLKAGFDPYSYE